MPSAPGRSICTPNGVGLDPGFSIYDTRTGARALKQAIKNTGVESGNWTPASLLSAVSQARTVSYRGGVRGLKAHDFWARTVARCYAAYEKILVRMMRSTSTTCSSVPH